MNDHDVEDRPYKWEIEPHPYDSSYDILVTDDDELARRAVMDAAEKLWDAMEAGEEKTIVIRMHEVPTPAEQSK